MRSFETARGGGGYQPKVTYTYRVDGVAYTADRWSYTTQGLKHAVAEMKSAAVPDEVDVFYDPAAPGEAYLQKSGPVLVISGRPHSEGWWFAVA